MAFPVAASGAGTALAGGLEALAGRGLNVTLRQTGGGGGRRAELTPAGRATGRGEHPGAPRPRPELAAGPHRWEGAFLAPLGDLPSEARALVLGCGGQCPGGGGGLVERNLEVIELAARDPNRRAAFLSSWPGLGPPQLRGLNWTSAAAAGLAQPIWS